MKIAVVGCGALGSYYGAKLLRDGQPVHFLLRSNYETVRRKGVFIRSPEGDFHVNPRCARQPDEVGNCDLVLIGLKTTANDQFSKLLSPLVGADTAILTLQNGLGNEESLAALFGRKQVLGGLCYVCLNRLKPGVIQHVAHGKIVLGEFGGWPEPRTHNLAAMIRHAGVPCKVTDDLVKARWEKLVWNIPFNGLGVASAAGYDALTQPQGGLALPRLPCLTTDQLLANPRWEALVRELMQEIIAAARALGHNVSPELAEKQIMLTRGLGPYRASTLVDFERQQPLELESLFREPLRQAKLAGAATPRLEALCRVLEKLNPN